MAGSTGEIELNLVLIGCTGDGTSATGNTILGQRMFNVSASSVSVTKDVVSKFTCFDNITVKVVDCPGLIRTDMDSRQCTTSAALNMATALGMCNGGVDAFILVTRPVRFKKERREMLPTLKEILGDRYMHNLMVVVTGGDYLEEYMEDCGCGNISFKECCSQVLGAFKRYGDFSGRLLLINNRERDPQNNETQRREIIQLAESLRKQNGRYTSKSFEEAKTTRDKLIVQENLPMLNESIQRKVGQLAADLLKLKEPPSDTERERILQSLDDLKKEITERDKGTGLLNHLMAEVEKLKTALHRVEQLHCLDQKRKHMEAKSIWSRVCKKEKEVLTLLLMGTMGRGKSSLGNCILGCKNFEASNNTNAQTAEVEHAYSDFESFSLKVVDGPGLQDTKFSKLEEAERAILNMSKALTMCCEGVDAFLFVFRCDVRFTTGEVSSLETLKAIFGKDYFKHAIVVVTHGDQFKMKDITFYDWCKKQTGPFRELYKACDGRCVLFNNKEMDKEKQMAQREQLTQLVQKLKRRHGRYTADCFKRAASERQRMIVTLKQPILKEGIQRQAGILFSKIQKYYQQPCAEQKAEIEVAIGELKDSIQTEDKGHGLLKDLMKIVEEVERNLHDVVKLPRLAARLETTRKAALIWGVVGIVCSVVGGALSLAFPAASVAITLGLGAVNTLGSEIIKVVEHTTETDMKAINSKMSTKVSASNAT